MSAAELNMAAGEKVRLRIFFEFLQVHYLGTKGFSAQNIWRMK